MKCDHGVDFTDACSVCNKLFRDDGGFPHMGMDDFMLEVRRRILRLEKMMKNLVQ